MAVTPELPTEPLYLHDDLPYDEPGAWPVERGEGIHTQLGGVDEFHEGELVRRAPRGIFTDVKVWLVPA